MEGYSAETKQETDADTSTFFSIPDFIDFDIEYSQSCQKDLRVLFCGPWEKCPCLCYGGGMMKKP